jgi:HTH-type transcriptional regulator / antitoxin HigA
MKKKKIEKTYSYEPDYAVSPGDILKETLKELSISFNQVSVISGLTIQDVKSIIKGTKKIDRLIAKELEKVTKIPVRLWLNREKGYREQLKILKSEK